LDAVLSRFGSEHTMNNLEEIDEFFAALICSQDVAKPSEYLPEIGGGEMADDEAFADRQELQDFLSLLLPHWNSIVRILQEKDVFAPLLSKIRKVRLTPMTGHADSCVAFACIMKAGENCSTMKNMEVH
jgi:yecA family protein